MEANIPEPAANNNASTTRPAKRDRKAMYTKTSEEGEEVQQEESSGCIAAPPQRFRSGDSATTNEGKCSIFVKSFELNLTERIEFRKKNTQL